MIIYGSLLIPFIIAIILYKYYSHKTVWWEFFIPLFVSLIFTIIMKLSIEQMQITSKEYWGSFIQKALYYEDWNEYIQQTCTSTCCCDSKGNNCITTTYDCSYVKYHPAKWLIETTTGESMKITNVQYDKIKKLFFKNESFVELNRDYHTNDGDLYYSLWPKDSTSSISVTTLHHYENRIKAADQSIFHFEEVKKEDIEKYNLKEYPEIYNNYEMDVVLGDNSKEAKIANEQIKYINSLLGHKKEVKIFVLIFNNQPIEAGLYQEWYWSGANMNEFVICIGIDKNRKVKWCKPISWTECEKLKTDVKNFVINQDQLNLSSLSSFLLTNIDKQFTRRNFDEFDYLTVEPPTWAIILTYILTIGINILLSKWIINNEYEE